MKFNSHEERMRHPQAKIIPECIWKNPDSLWNQINLLNRHSDIEFPKDLIQLVEVLQDNPDLLLVYIKQNQFQLKALNKKVGLIILLSHPEIQFELLCQINSLLGISYKTFFILCVESGNLRLIQLIANLYEGNSWIQGFIQADRYCSFRLAATYGHLMILHYLTEQTNKPEAMVSAYRYESFRKAAAHGHMMALYFLAELIPNDLKNVIAEGHYYAFREAAAHGHVQVLRYLAEQAPDKLQIMLAVNHYEPFLKAATYGHVQVLRYLAEQAPNKLQAMIASKDYLPFSKAAAQGKLQSLQYLVEQAPDRLQDMIVSRNYEAFRRAASYGHVAVLRYLAEQAPHKLEAMITANNYEAFRHAAEYNHDETVHFLLSKSTAFAYAESHGHEFTRYFPFVIQEQLDVLRVVREENDEIELSTEQARQFFYLARALIRRRASIDDLRLVLELPEVRMLVHQAITPHRPNELLCLAARFRHQTACEYLLSISSVRRLAEVHNFYNNYYLDQFQIRPNLRVITQDRESSMIALSGEENDRLEALRAHYFKKDSKNPNQILKELRAFLLNRYERNPANIVVSDLHGRTRNMNLPFAWEEFRSLSLSKRETQVALEAYYQNKDHSAWRFLAKPNPWMHPEALYIYENDSGAWSCFEDYVDLIALLFLAAKDENMPGVDGYGIADRVTQFIDELALIARAHNWDESNENQGEYDDLKADRPSCFSGTKRRLFQSVQGHPLLKQLTSDILRQELHELVWSHFQDVITERNHQALSNIWKKSIEMEPFTSEEKVILSRTNISINKQRDWLETLENKYGKQIKHHEVFLNQLLNSLNQENHFIHFSYLGLNQLLENPSFQTGNSVSSLEAVRREPSVVTNGSVRFFSRNSNHQDRNITPHHYLSDNLF